MEELSRKVYVYGYGEVSSQMALLDNPTRRSILYLLATSGPLTLKELATRLNLSPSTVLAHLRKLKDAGIIMEAEKHPKKFKVEVYYKLSIPFLLASELDEYSRKLEEHVKKFSDAVKQVFEDIKREVLKTTPKCVKGEDTSTLDKATVALLLNLNALVLSKLVQGPFIYIVVDDSKKN